MEINIIIAAELRAARTGGTYANARKSVVTELNPPPPAYNKVDHLRRLEVERDEIEKSEHPNKKNMLANHDAEIAKVKAL